MTYLEICHRKNENPKPKYKVEMGATAACTVRIAEGVSQSEYDRVRETMMGDSWFGSVKTACESHKKGKEGIFQVKIAKKVVSKRGTGADVRREAWGCHVVMKGTHPETGAVLIALGYKYNSKTTLCFVATENAGSTTEGVPYEMKYLDGNGNLCIREVERPQMVSDFLSCQHNQFTQPPQTVLPPP
jgi:hypothetical protein